MAALSGITGRIEDPANEAVGRVKQGIGNATGSDKPEA